MVKGRAWVYFALRSSNSSSVYSPAAYSFRSSTIEWPTASENAAFCRQSRSSGSQPPRSKAWRSRYLPMPRRFIFSAGSSDMT